MSQFAPQPFTPQSVHQPHVNESVQFPEFDGFNPEMFEITAEHFEAVSSIEPIAVTVGALNDLTTT